MNQSVFQKGVAPIIIIFLSIEVVIFSGIFAYYYLWLPREEARLTQQAEILAEGKKDKNGCLITSGDVWCSTKEKCIHVLAEDCFSAEGIQLALAEKYNKKITDVFVTVTKENLLYAVGRVSFAPKGGAGGIFLATKISGKWELIFDGNGSIDCNKIKQIYAFSQDMLAGFCD